MLDVVIVKVGVESDFISKAEELGFDELILLYEDTKTLSDSYLQALKKSTTLHLRFGPFSKKQSSLSLLTEEVALGTSLSGLQKNISYVYDLEYTESKDHLHQRKSGANEVLLKEMKEKHIGLLINLSRLRLLSLPEQSMVLGKITQNILLAQKIKLPVHFVSMAKDVSGMRNPTDVASLSRILTN